MVLRCSIDVSRPRQRLAGGQPPPHCDAQCPTLQIWWAVGGNWRREWDSNPRVACATAGFQVRCIRPLCHLSGSRMMPQIGAGGPDWLGPSRPLVRRQRRTPRRHAPKSARVPDARSQVRCIRPRCHLSGSRMMPQIDAGGPDWLGPSRPSVRRLRRTPRLHAPRSARVPVARSQVRCIRPVCHLSGRCMMPQVRPRGRHARPGRARGGCLRAGAARSRWRRSHPAARAGRCRGNPVG